MLDRIDLAGFKSIREMSLPLRPMNVLIGANGAGKSNFVSAFGLLNQIVEGRLQVAVARAGGAATLLHYGPKHTASVALALQFGRNSYEAQLSVAEGDTLFFESESCSGQGMRYSRPFHVALGSGHKETKLPVEAAHYPGRIASRVLDELRSWKVYHFHDTSPSAPVKQRGKLGDNDMLRPDASNLAAFLYRLLHTEPNAYQRILFSIRQVAPFFDNFVLRPDPIKPDAIQLEWSEIGSDAYFNAHSLSDGTLRFICLAVLLLQPTPPSLVLIDEPELGLHPYAVTQLAAMLQSAAARTQVLVATQSVTLMNQFDPDDVVVVDRADGQSTFRRVSAEEVATWADDYGLGEIWEKNILGGRPQRP